MLNFLPDTLNMLLIVFFCFKKFICSSCVIELIVRGTQEDEIHNKFVFQGEEQRYNLTKNISERINEQKRINCQNDKYPNDSEEIEPINLHLFKIDRYEDFIVRFMVFEDYLLDRNSKKKSLYVANLINKDEITIFLNICLGNIHDLGISISPPTFFRILNFISYLIPESQKYSLNIYSALINIGFLGKYGKDIVSFYHNSDFSIDKRHFIMFLTCFFSPICLCIENDAIIFSNRECSKNIYDFSTCFSIKINSFNTTCSIFYYLMKKLNKTQIFAFFWCLRNLNIKKIKFLGLKTYTLKYCDIPQTQEDGLEERILVRKYQRMSLNLASFFINDDFNENIIEVDYADKLDVCKNFNFLYRFKNLEILHIESIQWVLKKVSLIDASYFLLKVRYLLLKNIILTKQVLQEIFRMKIVELAIEKCELLGEITNNICTGQEIGFFTIKKIRFIELKKTSSVIEIFTRIKYLTHFYYKSIDSICLKYSCRQNNEGIFKSLKVLNICCSNTCDCLYSFLNKMRSLESLRFERLIRTGFDLDFDFGNLFKVRNLRYSIKILEISNAKLKEHSISKISKFSKLETLSLNNCEVCIFCFPMKFVFTNLQALKEVNLERSKISSIGIKFLKSCHNLETLILTNCNLTYYHVKKIRSFSKKCLRSLKKLHLFGNNISADMLLFILNLPTLESLEISYDTKSFENLLQNPEIIFSASIDYLGISKAYITKFSLRTLIRRSNITKILFMNCSFADDSTILLRKDDVDRIESFQVRDCNLSQNLIKEFILLFKEDVYKRIN
ncbi:hypothetical protein CWI36_0343p0020 [Hamiltosporidium magnivora]|uniref:Leucine rich repeat protein n=1 Tax=Hamiltosporidium magnivora TaxID=148818 RepID=A0A4Q9LGX7_9MICR|nr:hypothetical protein CWI36_0343p0020 [Hamiltosporidium magnivora]